MKDKIENNGITYTLQENEYYLPDLNLREETETRPVGKYGRMRYGYLKNHRCVLYTNLLTTGKLQSHLANVEEQVQQQIDVLVKHITQAQGVTEELKASDQLHWVGLMNNIKACAEEIVINEIIYA